MRVRQQRVHVDVLLGRVALFADHPAHALVHQKLLVRLQVAQIGWQVANDCLDEGLSVPIVHLHEHLLGQLGDLEVRLACHVLHPRVTLVHKLVQFVHHCLQEGPMVDQEVGELADHVHDVGRDDGLVVLSLLLLAQPQQLLDEGDKEALFVFPVHGTRDAADGPAQRVQVLPRPLAAVNLHCDVSLIEFRSCTDRE